MVKKQRSMTRKQLRAAATVLLERGVTTGRGPINALARRLGNSPNTVHNWLSGRVEPVPEWAEHSIGMMFEIADLRDRVAELEKELAWPSWKRN